MDFAKKRTSSDRHLIAEQPGLFILSLGVALAFFIGYTTKTWFSPSRVSARLEKAASHIHKDVKVRFSGAHLSLSDGIFPRFAVVVSHVVLESSQACWAAPVLEVDELQLPISLLNLVRGQGPVRDIQAQSVRLILREDFKNCSAEEIQTGQDKEAQVATTPSPRIRLSPSEEAHRYRNDVRSIAIQNFQILSERNPLYSAELFNFMVRVKSFDPRIIEMTAKTHLLRDQQVGDYLSHANLFFQYKEFPAPSLQAHIFGNWREGHYSLIAGYDLMEGDLSIESDLKHIPLSQILAILQKYDLASKELNGRQVWVSAKGRMRTTFEKLRTSPFELRDMQLEGDLGDLKVERIQVLSVEPLKYSPIFIDIQNLDVAKLLVLLNRPKSTSVVGDLGRFTGRAEVISDQNIRLRGEHTGLEFVFSNKGQREMQVIDTMVGDIALEKDHWNFRVHRVVPRGGSFIGDIKLKADRDFRDVEVRTHIDEVSLAAPVQKLMTQGGSIGTLGMDMVLRLQGGQVQSIKGQTQVDMMSVEGVDLHKTRVSVEGKAGDVTLNTQFKILKVGGASPAAAVLKQVTPNEWWTEGSLEMQTVSGQFHWQNLKAMQWKNVQGTIQKTGKLLTEGSWDDKGLLKGQVQNRDGKNQKKWVIQGDRENPLFMEQVSSTSAVKR